MVKKKACIFISGSGTNLKSIIKNSRDYNFPIKINLVITNKKNAGGIYFAKKFSIPYLILNKNQKNLEKIALNELRKYKINLICLAGFMRILSKKFVRSFKGHIINIHPSLLPKYKGLNTFKRALNDKEKITGCTVHFVDEKLDNGRFILKKRVWIDKKDTPEILKRKVQAEEYKVYSFAIRKIYNYI
ncbi:MAG: phosphoribosylglycinamide formyltransferase [Candidatus Pelagibacter sp.]|nr:phosphoribosylglycinamide formyltransferase [Candidatus Pelagibacter sp.]|tara:strand:- start:108 stop:671 length:564 start_codon:yes stop_codon:yes gene_type:complete